MTCQPLAIHRQRHLLSQRTLAREAGVTESTIYLIESGKSRPYLKTMHKLCTALGVDWEDVAEFRASMAQFGVEAKG